MLQTVGLCLLIWFVLTVLICDRHGGKRMKSVIIEQEMACSDGETHFDSVVHIEIFYKLNDIDSHKCWNIDFIDVVVLDDAAHRFAGMFKSLVSMDGTWFRERALIAVADAEGLNPLERHYE
jgi:hypothetical protein